MQISGISIFTGALPNDSFLGTRTASKGKEASRKTNLHSQVAADEAWSGGLQCRLPLLLCSETSPN